MRGGRTVVGLDDGAVLQAEAVVLAPGVFAPGTAWAPAELGASPRLVADPWAPDALEPVPDDGDVLLVGTGLTAVDVALTLDRPWRRLHMVSRRGRLPAVHATREHAPTPATPRALVAAASSRTTDLQTVRWLFRSLLRDALRRSGDWRAAFDAVRPFTATLWSALDERDRAEFLRQDAAWWDLHRHRMAPSTAATLHRMRRDGRLTVAADQVDAVEDLGDSMEVRLASGRTVRIAAVVNCTGPLGDVRRAGDPLLDHLLAAGTATGGPLGLGLRTDAGRLVDARGTTDAPVWTLGAMRRGELWESTAVPEIREQAVTVATAVSRHVAAGPRRRPRDTVTLVPSVGATAGSPSGRWHAP